MTGPADDATWDERARHETPTEQLDRNWGDLLQELRVTQTGVQLLTAFLLTLPFQARFDVLDATQHVVYLATVSASTVAAGLLIAPVAVHRTLFRRHARRDTVSIGHRLAVGGLALLGLAIVGVVEIVFAALTTTLAASVAASVVAVVLVSLWVVLPLSYRSRLRRTDPRAPGLR